MKDRVYDLLKLILCFFCFFYVGNILIVLLKLFNINIGNSIMSSVIYQFVVSLIMFILLFCVYYKNIKKDFIKFKKNINFNISYIIKMFIIFMIVKYLIGLITVFIFMTLGFDITNISSVNQDLASTYIKTAPILMLITAAFLAPLYEETLFRLGIKKIIKNKYLFIILSGAIFGLLHIFPLDDNITLLVGAIQSISYVTMGIFFSYIYYKTDNIFINTGIHFLNNFLSVLTMINLF